MMSYLLIPAVILLICPDLVLSIYCGSISKKVLSLLLSVQTAAAVGVATIVFFAIFNSVGMQSILFGIIFLILILYQMYRTISDLFQTPIIYEGNVSLHYFYSKGTFFMYHLKLLDQTKKIPLQIGSRVAKRLEVKFGSSRRFAADKPFHAKVTYLSHTRYVLILENESAV